MYVVDGYNLLHALIKRYYDMPQEFIPARTRTLDLLEAWALAKEARVLVFLDGTPGPGPAVDAARPHLRLIYTGGEADGEICDYVRTAVELNDVTVISSDREVSGTCRLHGAGTITSEVMAKRLKPYLARAIEGRSPHAYRRRDARTQPREKGVPAPVPVKAKVPVKPKVTPQAPLSEFEQEMLAELEDFEDLAREALRDEPLPEIRQPELPNERVTGRRPKGGHGHRR